MGCNQGKKLKGSRELKKLASSINQDVRGKRGKKERVPLESVRLLAIYQ